MAEIAVNVRLSGAKEAADALQKLDATATTASRAAKDVGGAAASASSGLKSMGGSAADAAKGSAAIGAASKAATAGIAAMGAATAAAVAPLLALVSVGQAITSTFGNIVEFDKISGQMKTVTGSAEGATVAMAGLRELATKLPVSLEEVAGAFVKLQSRGFDTTSESMIRLSDLASALGKGFDQTAEAITDLAVGQTMRMEELGIAVTQNNGKVQLSFGKTAIEVERNAADIQRAINQISLENFAGASEEQMGRLTGQISNLGDAWAGLSVAIGQSGIYDIIAAIVSKSADAMVWLTKEVKQTASSFSALWEVMKNPGNAVEIIKKANQEYAAIEKQFAGGSAAALDAYNKQSAAATEASRKRLAAIKKEQEEAADAAAKEKQRQAEAEAASKAAAAAAKAYAAAIKSQAEQQTQAVETYTEKLDRQLEAYNALAKAAGGAFSSEALIRSQTAALAEYGQAVDSAYASEIQRAKAGVDQARNLYEQVAASEQYVALQREIADSKASNAIELASEGLISQEAATRSASAAWAQYKREVDGADFGGIVAEWSRLNVEIGYTPEILRVTAEQMLAFGLAANSTEVAVAGVIDTIGKVELETKKQTDAAEEAWKNASRSIQSSLGDAFYQALDGGIKSFRDFADTVVDVMKRAAAEIAAALVFKSVFTGVEGAVGSVAGAAAGSASESGIIAAIKGSASSIMGSVSAGAASILPSLASVTSAIGPAAGAVVGAIGPVGLAIAGGVAAFALFGDQIKAALGSVIEGLGNIVSGIAGAVGDLLGGIADAVGDLISGIAGAIGGAVTDAAGGVIGFVGDTVGGVVDAVGDVLGGIFHGGGVVGKTAVQTRSLPATTWAGAPRLHSGTPSLRHDEVPAILQKGEAVIPLKGGAVPVVGMGGGGKSTINIYGAPAGTRSRRRAGSVDVFVRNIERELTPMEAMGG